MLGAVAIGLAAASAPAAAERPHILYMLHCQGCHGPDGAGAQGSVPALGGFVGRFLGVPGGREYLVQVPGSAGSPLADAELAAVLNWMVERFGPDDVAEDFPRYDASEVGRARKTPLLDVTSTRARLVERIRTSRPSEGRPPRP